MYIFATKIKGEFDMKTAIVILTYNAEYNNDWRKILQAYASQDFNADLRLIYDSSSTDNTCTVAKEFHWQIRSIKQAEFNHGRTRQMLVDELDHNGFDAVIFATQDALLSSGNTLSIMVNELKNSNAAAVYARQIPRDPHTFDGFFRSLNYPAESCIKQKSDIPGLGLMTPFCSNTLAVWNIHKVQAAGGFPATGFGEDMLLAAELIRNGETISYCAEAECIHSHQDTIPNLWSRGFAIGCMHRNHPQLLQDFGRAESRVRAFRIVYLPGMIIKYAGYLCGRYCSRKGDG
jgi:rhamnosyltransferase